MPLYEYAILDRAGEPTGDTFEVFQRMADKPLSRDPLTGASCRRVPSLVRQGGARRWDMDTDEREARSISLAFNPKNIAEIKRQCPSMELAEDGAVIFRNDAHQRRVYGEMAKVKKEADQRRQAVVDSLKPRYDPPNRKFQGAMRELVQRNNARKATDGKRAKQQR